MKYKVNGKIAEVGAPDGSRCIVGFAGSMLDGSKFLSWWRKNWHDEDLRDEIPDGDYEALVLYNTGDISLVNQGVEMFIDEPFFAIGSGKEFAMGALAMGATLEQAMRIAARYDNLTGYDTYELEI
jgi:ATP-dependent protease HslVU (ClpYQ) peptidase subunit